MITHDPSRTCGSCRHFDPAGGTCRAHPPQLVPMMQPNQLSQQMDVGSIGMFPPAEPTWWCGEWTVSRPLVVVNTTSGSTPHGATQ